MKFLGKMFFKIIFKVTGKQDSTLFIEDKFLKNPQRGGSG